MDTQHLTVAELMTPDPCAVDERLKIEDAVDRMLANNIRHLVVVRGAELAGVVALDDIHLAESVAGERANDAAVSTAMRPAFTCRPRTAVADVARAMEARRCDCVVVIDDENEIIGIFTISDALRALRQLDAGELVEPEVMPTHNRAPYEPRERRKIASAHDILDDHGASPRARDGLAFGRVFPDRH